MRKEKESKGELNSVKDTLNYYFYYNRIWRHPCAARKHVTKNSICQQVIKPQIRQMKND